MIQDRYCIYKTLRTVLIIGSISLLSFKIPDTYKQNRGSEYEKPVQVEKQSVLLSKIGYSIQRYNALSDTAKLLSLADSLKKVVPGNYPDSSLAEIYYYIGVCELLANRSQESEKWLIQSVEVKRKLNIKDDHYAKGIFNLGILYSLQGDNYRAYTYFLRYIEEFAGLYGENSSDIAETYSALTGVSIELKDFRKFTEFAFKALEMLDKNKNILHGSRLSSLYSNIGIGYIRMGDFVKGRIYLEKSESIIKEGYTIGDQNYINLLNSLGITYRNLKMNDKASEYFDKGIELAISSNSNLAYNMINTYVIDLGNSGRVEEGKDLLSGLVTKAGNVYGRESRYFIEVLKNYADFLSNYTDDLSQSLLLYSECQVYVNNHPEDFILRDQTLMGYSLALHKKGENIKALEKIRELLLSGKENYTVIDLYRNPGADSLTADRRTLRILQTKYSILWDMYNTSGGQKVLEAAAGTSELMISVLDKVRINISEEESREILGTHFRETYLQAIRSFELCYRNSGERRFLEKAFEFAEKSKVAGLLASTRELNAIQFHIPTEIADLEQDYQKEISICNSRISNEIEKGTPDKKLMAGLNEKLFSVIKSRDSLIITFEKDYPAYYSLKYSSNVPSLKEIPSITGRNNNYLNYVMSDSLLYIFIVNRKHQEIITIKTDSSFISKLREFKMLLSDPSPSESARKLFNDFQNTGSDLFRILIEPVRKYLISDNLMISPDNILSYIPFETLLTSKYIGDEILYRGLNYMMNDYSISYVYSATFMQENINRHYGKTKDLVAFAPVYDRTINIDSLFLKRQSGGVLYPLPYSRQEAEYVSQITRGQLYLDNEARESTFKKEAGKYDIIHMAMHTVLNDTYPMNSAMIFTQSSDSAEDGFLNTFEIYGLPLKAKMVVLSSCNTGFGRLSSGEGILSLARGFLYSGSQSVVMSLWEIEDKSGTDIINMFYDNLLKGKSKSRALKIARKEYLKKAGQLRSHPYFWSTLVIYGNNSPLYGQYKKLIMIVIALIVISGLFYFLKRRYS